MSNYYAINCWCHQLVENLLCFYSEELQGQEAMTIIEECPTNFGIWDKVLDPASAKVRVEKMIKAKSSTQTLIENEIKQMELVNHFPHNLLLPPTRKKSRIHFFCG